MPLQSATGYEASSLEGSKPGSAPVTTAKADASGQRQLDAASSQQEATPQQGVSEATEKNSSIDGIRRVTTTLRERRAAQ